MKGLIGVVFAGCFILWALLTFDQGGERSERAHSSSTPAAEGARHPSVGFTDNSTKGGSPWITAHFSPGLSTRLIELIDRAEDSIDVVAYEIDHPEIASAIAAAVDRGVSVRVVTDSDHLSTDAVRSIVAAGVPVRGDERSGLMHNKFLIFDQETVWTGSFNLTLNGDQRNDNNALVIRSRPIAESFRAEFAEMFHHGRFGPHSPSATPHSLVRNGDEAIYLWFSPEDEVLSKLVRYLRLADEEITFMSFSFTDRAIAAEMLERARAGVRVRGVHEARSAASRYSVYRRLVDSGIDVRVDGNPWSMHHKVIVIDSIWTITGSYNFSRNAAESNDENLLIVKSSRIALQYLGEFERVRSRTSDLVWSE